MRRSVSASTVSIALVLVHTNATAAGAPGTAASSVTPVVFIVMDTSGSMSYADKDQVVPNCSPDATATPGLLYGSSRDITAKQVFSGTYNDYWCQDVPRPNGRFDFGYPVAWFVPKYSTQETDGLLDTYKGRVKFGFATFDTVPSSATDGTGDWSWGTDETTVAGIGPVNLGIRHESSPFGGLIVPSAADDALALESNATAVKAAVEAMIPFGGTPIAPALDDVRRLFDTHPNFQRKTLANPNGDPYAMCRPKHVVLVTDGRPTLGEKLWGYPSSEKAAEELYKRGFRVYVVGFNIDASTTNAVNAIAKAGGTGEAFIASNINTLKTALSNVLQKATPGIFSRTDVVATDVTGSATDLQYQINTAYGAARWSDVDLAGYMEVTSYRCDATCRNKVTGSAGPCEVTDLRAKLPNQTDRKLFVTIDGKMEALAASTTVTPEKLAVPVTGTLPDVEPVYKDNLYQVSGNSLGDASDPAVRATFTSDLIKLLYGKAGSRRVKEPLGAIQHSTPVVQSNLSTMDVAIPSFKAYQKSIETRPTVAYFSTHEGFVHAVHMSQPAGGLSAELKWLQELWAIAPEQAATRAWKLVTKPEVLLDGPPVLKDIRLVRSNATLSIAEEVKLWRSVLVVPFRQGGRGLFALDVTNPLKPWVRWEISNTRHCWNDGVDSSGSISCKPYDDSDRHDYRNLGYTHGKPKIGTVFIRNETTNVLEEVAAVFTACGEADAATGEVESGKCFMVTRLDNGDKIREFRNGNGTVKDKSGAPDNVEDTLDFTIVGDPAVYNTFIGTFVTRIFVGDKGGQLWRIDVSDPDPLKWTMNFFFDPYFENDGSGLGSTARSPLKSEPSMSPVPQRGQLVVVMGTGDLEYATDPAQRAMVFSVKEKMTITDAGVVTATTNEVLWKKVLEVGESLTSKPLIYGNVAYFTSFQPDATDACQGGTGRVWGLDFLKSKAGTKEPVGKFPLKPIPLNTADFGEKIEIPDVVPYGLSLISRPACSGDSGVSQAAGAGGSNSALKGSKGGTTELVVQTGSFGKSDAGALPANPNVPPAVNKIARQLTKPPKQVVGVGWGHIQNL